MPHSPEQPFYIPATGPSSRARKTLKHDDTFAVLDSHGDIGVASGGPDGLFDADTRFLSYFEMRVNETAPLLLGVSSREDNLHLYFDLTNTDIVKDGVVVLPKDNLHISRTVFLRDGAMHTRIALENHSGQRLECRLSLLFDNDFADIFEVRGLHREKRGRGSKRIVDEATVALVYRGLDNVERQSTLTFEPPPDRLETGSALYNIMLERSERCVVFVAVGSRGKGDRALVPFFKGLRAARRQMQELTGELATIETSSTSINRILCRAVADFYMLVTKTEDGAYPYAGIPWFSTTFGRDGLIAAMQLLWLDPSIARGVLRRLAALQADSIDVRRDAEPGKILHEMRRGEMAGLGEVPFGLYYGSVDSTPLFVMLAGLYHARTGDDALLRQLWPHIERALQWMDRYGDADGDGFIEYARAAETGLANQGWKDSFDSVFHADGRLAEGPIALVEVQAYAYAAKRQAATIAEKLGKAAASARLTKEAARLRARFETAFWVDDLDAYALALDGAKRPCAVMTSNAFHALLGGIAAPERGRKMAARLGTAAMSSGWGIRTVALGEARYNPMSYHNGSVWPHDNAMIAAGLARYGVKEPIVPLFDGMCRAATWMDYGRLPELFCGFAAKRGRGPVLYPVACSPQAWASGSLLMMLQAMLGVEFAPECGEIRLRNPVVPASLGDVTVRNLRLGDAAVDFSVRRDRDAISLRVLRAQGAIKVVLINDPFRADVESR